MAKKAQKPKWRRENGRDVVTLPNDPLAQVTNDRRARREAAKEAGMLGPRGGTGAHGGNKRDQRRRERRKVEADLRSGSFDG